VSLHHIVKRLQLPETAHTIIKAEYVWISKNN